MLSETFGELVNFEVHASGEGVHVSTGYYSFFVAPHDAAQNVHGGVGAHHVAAALVVDFSGHRAANFWEGACQFVEHASFYGTYVKYGGCSLVPGEVAGVVGLSAAGGVEGGAVKFDAVAVVTNYCRGEVS